MIGSFPDPYPDELMYSVAARYKERIERKWNTLLNISGAVPKPESHRCFPETILELFAQKAYEATLELKCDIVTPQTNHPIYSLLNQAWDEFWAKPNGYIA